jgi:hypothetical protein
MPLFPSRYRLPTPQTDLPELARIVADMRVGRLDVGREVTMASGTTTTVIRGNTVGIDSIPILVPTTSTGAALAWWLSSRAKGALTLGHDAPGADELFLLLLIG